MDASAPSSTVSCPCVGSSVPTTAEESSNTFTLLDLPTAAPAGYSDMVATSSLPEDDMKNRLLKASDPLLEDKTQKKPTLHIQQNLLHMTPQMSSEAMNQTPASEFFMLGFSSHPQLPSTFFTLFFLVYLMALFGNLSIIITIGADARLHTPMYFFLANLAILDISCTSSTIPKMLDNLISETKSISYAGCITQLFLLSSVLSVEVLLLTLMALDRYVAICIPLRYGSMMKMRFCVFIMAIIWLCGLLNSSIHTGLITRLSFYGRIVLDHFFCEIPPVLKVSSTDTHINDIVILVADVFLGMFCFCLTLLSYMNILSSVLKISSVGNKRKAFSTCTSHLLVVIMFYGGIIYTYVRPVLNIAGDKDKVVSVIYAVVAPVLNPFIYSLRNQELLEALIRTFSRKICASRK
ncbi:olfactory receptor 13G1-like [Ambystoma mexicanum]|uniref:olfactory receptor 13G1-like n=1 Tax=Ambystoma mexicanum TaxID=8296 RepID=UPI0037E71153